MLLFTSCSDHSSASKNDSKLTLLIREMYDEALTAKQAILANERPESLDHEAILTAQSTQPKKAQSELFKTFVSDYLTTTKQLNQAGILYQKAAFKNVVTNCVNCHSSMCLVPLVRIKNLK